MWCLFKMVILSRFKFRLLSLHKNRWETLKAMERVGKSCSSALPGISEPPQKILKCESIDSAQDVSLEPSVKCDDETVETLCVLAKMGAVVDQEDDLGLTPLFHAVRRNDIAMIRALVHAGADVNYTSVADNLFLGGTALHQAAAKANPNTVKELIGLGAQVNLEDHFGKTPLHWAAWEGRLETMMVLTARGGDLSAEDSWDRSLLHMAADGGHAEVVRWLLETGADPIATCSEDNTPLHYAAGGGHIGVMELLLPHTLTDCRDILGRTPLMCAVRYGKVEAVKLLLEAGATPNNKDDFGVSVIDWTSDLDSPEIALILIHALRSSDDSEHVYSARRMDNV